MALDEDHSVYFDTDIFGSAATIDGKNGTIDGLFDDEYELTDIGEVGVGSTVPVFTCAISDLLDSFYTKLTDFHGKELNVNDIQYEIVHSRPDGTGQVTLILKFLHEWLT